MSIVLSFSTSFISYILFPPNFTDSGHFGEFDEPAAGHEVERGISISPGSPRFHGETGIFIVNYELLSCFFIFIGEL